MKRFWKLCSMVLVLSMLLNMLPMHAFATEKQTDDQGILTEGQNVQADNLVAETANEEMTAKDAYVLGEVIEERTQYSKTFRLSNGLQMAAVYSEPVHYEKNGQWEEIDNTLQLSNGRSGNAYSNTAGKWFVSFPQRLTESNGVTISMEDYFLSFRMAGELRNTGDAELDTLAIEEETMLDAAAEAEVLDSAQEPAADKMVMAVEDSLVAPMAESDICIEQTNTDDIRDIVKHEEMIANKAASSLRYEDVYANTDLVYDLISNQVKEYITLNIHRRISMSELAAHVGVSRNYLTNLFSACEQQPISEYINRVKLNHLLELMDKYGVSMQEAAEAVGFSDVNYVSRIFRKYYGVTLSEHRRMLRK